MYQLVCHNMKKENMMLWGLAALSAALMSLPFLVPHAGMTALFGLVPLLCMEKIASELGKRNIWIFHYSAFVMWNAFTTFWVCNATIGGGIFAILANSLQMSLIFGLFRLSKKKFSGALPYIFLAAAWIAWERFYFDAEISWPWLVLGNSFARTTWAVQWYEFTGSLGGSLWIWTCNLLLFGLMTRLSDGSWNRLNAKARTAYIFGYATILTVPFLVSFAIGKQYEDSMQRGSQLPVAIIQPNIDPYNKFQAMSQADQTAMLLSQISRLQDMQPDLFALGTAAGSSSAPLLILAPETFTNDITTGDYESSRTWRSFVSYLSDKPGVNLLFGSSSWDRIRSSEAPSHTARRLGDGTWIESHNSALMVDGTGRTEIFHKNKLVVAVEMTPYPAFFCKIDDMLGGVMGRCVGQEGISLLHVNAEGMAPLPVGCAICYESVYGEYYTGYVRKGARAMTVITNDAWWGDTPGYVQHLSYSCLRAIETRRAIARCANTGISAIISPSGEIICRTPWWEQTVLTGSLPLRDDMTFFVAHGDIAGRICTFVFCLLLLALAVRFTVGR